MLVLLDWLGALTIAVGLGVLALVLRQSGRRGAERIAAAPVHWVERNRLVAEERLRLLGVATAAAISLAYFSLSLVGESSRLDALLVGRVAIVGSFVLLGDSVRRLDAAVLGVPDGLRRRDAVLGWWTMRPAAVWLLTSAMLAPTEPSVRGLLPWTIALLALLVVELRLEAVLDRLGLLRPAPELDPLAHDVGAGGAVEVRSPVPVVFVLGSGRLAVATAALSAVEREQLRSVAREVVTWSRGVRRPRLVVHLPAIVLAVSPGAAVAAKGSLSGSVLSLGATLMTVVGAIALARRVSRRAMEEVERSRPGDELVPVAMAAERFHQVSGRPVTSRSGVHADLASHLRAAGREPQWQTPGRPRPGPAIRGAVVGLGAGLLPLVLAIGLLGLPGRTGQIAAVAFMGDDSWPAARLAIDLVEEGDLAGADRVVDLVDGESSDVAFLLLGELVARGRCDISVSTFDLAVSDDPPLDTALRVCGHGAF